jgi:hypothetical protein
MLVNKTIKESCNHNIGQRKEFIVTFKMEGGKIKSSLPWFILLVHRKKLIFLFWKERSKKGT